MLPFLLRFLMVSVSRNIQIFESKGDLGLFCNVKRHVTVPQEFHFAIDERIPPPAPVFDLFDKVVEEEPADVSNC